MIPKQAKKKRQPSIKTLRDKCDTLFSKWVRMSAADDFGAAKCVTCGKRDRWQDMDAGHFVPRACLSLRWDETNVHPQCRRCNRFRTDMYADYALFMVDKYGRLYVEGLLLQKQKPHKLTRGDLEARIDDLSEKLAGLAMGVVRESKASRYALEALF